MKTKNILLGLACFSMLISCNDFLDREPISDITPEQYLNEESQLAAYTAGRYKEILPYHKQSSYGMYGEDQHTDNMAYKNYDIRWLPGEWKVANSGGDWNFSKIYSCNYFMTDVLPKWAKGQITGNAENINHYVGEMYFFRAYEYFTKLQQLGDFPILRQIYPDQKEILIEASKRAPRNEVARFILSDLDSAIVLLKDVAPDGLKNRISKDCARLFKSRVALFEGTWLKYFKGTAFVPNGPGWPGKEKAYNKDYNYPSGDIDAEINYFLSTAMEASKEIAEKYALVENNQVLQQEATDPVNPYFNMFGDENMSTYGEVLLWAKSNLALNVLNCVSFSATMGNYHVGTTRGMVETFLMENGLPIYAQGSGYLGDDSISMVRQGRDNRLVLFLKEPRQKNLVTNVAGNVNKAEETYPMLLSTNDDKYTTGYALRKGGSFNGAVGGSSYSSTTGCIVFRATEAYLNYLEASYEKSGVLDEDAKRYWTAIRERGGVDTDYQKTIAHTDLSKEAPNDWGVYSAGTMVDPVLYNIRRERRCELIAEGFRYMDLKRWRALDQMINTPYHIEGFKLWGPMQNWYFDEKEGKSTLIYGKDNLEANVSDPALSPYYRPYEILETSLAFKGYRWKMAHYLSPIAYSHLLISSNNGDISTSPIYQNPHWPAEANMPPIQ